MTDSEKIKILAKALDDLINYAVMADEQNYGTLNARMVEDIATEALDRVEETDD